MSTENLTCAVKFTHVKNPQLGARIWNTSPIPVELQLMLCLDSQILLT